MPALLSLIPIRDWCYIAVIAALLAFGGTWYVKHNHAEQKIGEQKVEAADAKAVAAQTVRNQKVESNAQDAINAALAEYDASISAPPAVQPPRIVCHGAVAAGGRAVPGHAGASGAGDGSAVVPESTGPEFDPSKHVLSVGQAADAQVTLLQNYVRACQAAGLCKK